MYPHERSLVKRLEGKPFVLLGVNSDRDRKELKKVLEKEQITWRSWFDGGKIGGPIATQYNVHGWPTVYILDHKGVIHFKGHGGDFDKVIDKLVAEVEKSPSK
jgi:hypothetical protein